MSAKVLEKNILCPSFLLQAYLHCGALRMILQILWLPYSKQSWKFRHLKPL